MSFSDWELNIASFFSVPLPQCNIASLFGSRCPLVMFLVFLKLLKFI
jgi:hypothetical protein